MSFQLKNYLLAGYTGIMVCGAEDKRILADIEQLCQQTAEKRKEKFTFRVWTVVSRWQTGNKMDFNREGASTLADVKQDLKDMFSFKESGCYCMVNFHFFLKDPGVIQLIKELVFKWKAAEEEGEKHLIFVENVLTIPPELEKEITVLDYELPTKVELEEALNRVIVDENKKVRVELTDDEKDKVLSASLGMTSLEAENAFAISYIEKGTFDTDIINREKGQLLKKGGLLEFFPDIEYLTNVGGLGNIKDWIIERKRAFTPEARAFGITPPKGIILTGVSGTGKSLCAKAIASVLKLPLIRVDIGKAFGSLVGMSEERARMMTKQLDAMSPCIPWIDEAEKAFAGTRGSGATDSGVTMRVLGTFLTWLAETKYPIFAVMTVNDVSSLPPELTRKGRFDELFFVDIPNLMERQEIFKIHLQKRNRNSENFNLIKLAEISEGYVGSEIEEAVKTGLFKAFNAARELETEDIIKAIKDTIPITKTMDKEINELRQWASGRCRKANKEDTEIKATHRKLGTGDTVVRKGVSWN